MSWKPWLKTDPRTGRRFHWSYNPNIALGWGVVIGFVAGVMLGVQL